MVASQHLTIMLVDDSPDDRSAVRSFLLQNTTHDFSFQEFGNGKQALAAWLGRKPDAILLDYWMPDMTGLEFLASLAKQEQATYLPIVLLTGHDSASVAIEALRLGAQEYLPKAHLTPESLLRAVENAIEKCELRATNDLAQRALEAKSRHLQLAQEAAGIGSWQWEITTGQVTASATYFALYGRAGYTGSHSFETWLNWLHPDDRTSVQEELRECFETRGPYQTEFRVVLPTGEVRWLAGKATLYCDSQNRPERLVGINLDVTERKEADRKIARQALILSQVHESVIITDLGGIVTSWNAGAERLFGYTAAEAIGMPIANLYLPEHRETVHSAVLKPLIERGELRLDQVNVKKSGERCHISLSLSVLRDETGAPYGMIGYSLDITLRKHAEEQLKATLGQLQIYETAVARAHDSVLITEADPIGEPGPRITYVNEAFTRLTGYSPEEVIGRSPRILQGALTDRAELDRIRQALEKWQPVRSEVLNYTKDGNPFWVDMSIVPIADETGWYTNWVSVQRDTTLRRKSERDNAQLAAIVLHAGEALVRLSVKGKIETWNPAAERLFGFTATEAVGMPITAMARPDSEGELLALLGQVLSGTVVSSEISCVQRDGQELLVSLRAAPIRPSGQAIEGVSAVMQDVTEQRKAERDLRSRERQQAAVAFLGQLAMGEQPVRQLLEQAVRIVADTLEVEYVKVLEFDQPQMQFVLRAGYGLKPEFPMGTTAFPADETSQAGHLWASGKTIFFANDINEDLRFTSSSFFVEHGIVSGVSVAIPGTERSYGVLGAHTRHKRIFTQQDVHFLEALANLIGSAADRERTQIALRESWSLYHSLAEAVPAVLFTADSVGHIRYLNERFYEITGIQHPGVLGTDWTSALHTDDKQPFLQRWAEAARERTSFEVEFRLQRRDGVYRWFRCCVVPTGAEGGQPAKWFGACLDVDDQKRAEAALLRSNDELQQFAFAASHDLQEPLRTITTHTQILARRYKEQLDEEANDYIRQVVSGAQRMHALISDLLSLSREQTRALAPRDTDLNELVSFVRQQLSALIEEHGARIKQQTLPTLCVEPSSIALVLQNLITNAIKYRRPEAVPEIEISASPQGEAWLISVRDNGMGFEASQAGLIFQPFKRLHGHNIPGTGIGLAICNRVVERHGGRIWAEAVLGKGATFYLELPASKAANRVDGIARTAAEAGK